MISGLSRRSSRLPSLLVAVMALVSQLALGAVMKLDASPQAQLATALDAPSTLCHTGGADGGDRAPTHHRGSDHALCPLCFSLALTSVTLASAPQLPEPTLMLTQRARNLPPARAPPAPVSVAAYPRGPPSLV